ncbi:MAG: hypothetical protein SH818_03380 [Saprospiraceae bacterium]|nr:hypothetical protein [Saprospiraceae bacterium]
MSFLNHWFKKKSTPDEADVYETAFGRYTDAYKSPAQYEAWDRAIENFEKQEYKNALLDFVEYIKGSEPANVLMHDEKLVHFDIWQGSKTIEVRLKNGIVFVECRIASTTQMNIGFMRRLLDLNYELKYVRYGLTDENVIILLFDTLLSDASPYKLYFALKEMAIHADKQDDLLIHEFAFLSPILSGKIVPATQNEIIHKTTYFMRWIDQALQLVDHGRLKIEQYPAANGYIMLALIYKLDYLIRPEGALVDRVEQIHKNYFAQDQKNLQHKLKHMRQELAKLRQLNKDEIAREIYHTVSTFGITTPASPSALNELMDREFHALQWYLDHDYTDYAQAIVEYIAGISLFNYALPLPAKDLLHLLFRATEWAFCTGIRGFTSIVHKGLPDRGAIRVELVRLEKLHQKNYPALVLDHKLLKYDSILAFSYSLLRMIRTLQLQKSK